MCLNREMSHSIGVTKFSTLQLVDEQKTGGFLDAKYSTPKLVFILNCGNKQLHTAARACTQGWQILVARCPTAFVHMQGST